MPQLERLEMESLTFPHSSAFTSPDRTVCAICHDPILLILFYLYLIWTFFTFISGVFFNFFLVYRCRNFVEQYFIWFSF
jgi:hypothetical protein